jgi:CRISPR system Cascade subunit CasE
MDARVEDPGYALHAALKGALGAFAPRPFVLRWSANEPEILGYVESEPGAISAAAALPPIHDPAAADSLGLPLIEVRAMPAAWHEGQSWSFELRQRPVVRSRSNGREGSSPEIDVAFWRARRELETTLPSREAIYLSWLGERLAGGDAARLLEGRVIAMRSTRVLRRPVASGSRRSSSFIGPDVTVRGTVQVVNAEAFRVLLSSGVGRHCGFGFGCLLLAPPGAF